jgi:flagellar basal body-associated protein FliL
MKALLILIFFAGFIASLMLRDVLPVMLACGLCLAVLWVGDKATAKQRRAECEQVRASQGLGPSGLD